MSSAAAFFFYPSGRFRCRLHRWIIATLLMAVSGFFPLLAAAAPAQKNVLMINSYHRGYPWSDRIVDAIQLSLENGSEPPQFFLEYLDSRRTAAAPITNEFTSLLRRKYSRVPLDLVIVSDDAALTYVLAVREQLFPGLPLVFCGINELEKHSTAGPIPNATGVIEKSEFAPTFDAIRRLLPATRQVIVVGDDTNNGQIIRAQLASLAPRYPADWFTYLDASAQPFDELLARIRRLPSDTVVMPQNIARDSTGRLFPNSEAYLQITAASPVPVFSINDRILVGQGVVGGMVDSGQRQGQIAAGLARQILAGTPASSLPVVRDSTGEFIFDYEQLKRWHLPFDQLPAGATIINEPRSYYQEHRRLIWITASILLLQTLTIVFLVRNIRQRRRYAKALRASERLHKALVETDPDCILVTDRERRLTFASPRVARQFGAASDGLLGRPFEELLSADDRPAFLAAFQQLLTGGAPVHLEARCLRHPGDPFEAELDGGRIDPTQDGPHVAMFTLRDVTEKKQLQQQVFRSQRLDSLGTLAGGVAHDLNNILTPILFSISTLKETRPDPELLEILRPMELSAKRGASVLRQLLMFSRGLGGDKTLVDLAHVITETLEILSPSLPATLRRQLHLAKPAPCVHGDPTQLHQVVLNLIVNARDAMPVDGLLTIKLRPHHVAPALAAQHHGATPGPHVLLEVIDTGSGIDPALLDKIFDPFFTTKSAGKGTGLGLSVVLAIVKNHGGFLHVTSQRGHGTNFQVFLPASEAPAVAATPAPASTVAASPFPARATACILLAEDDPLIREFSRQTLEAHNFRVLLAHDGTEALALFKARRDEIDAVVTDIGMPGLNGVALGHALRELVPGLPILTVSGTSTVQNLRDTVRNSAHPFLNKPYDGPGLLAALRAILPPASK